MALTLTKHREPKGRLQYRIYELIKIYVKRLNKELSTQQPAELMRHIEKLTNYEEQRDQLLFESETALLKIYFKADPPKHFCSIQWT